MARPKGSKNKIGETAKDNILAVFIRLGGTAGMAVWAKENQNEFYRIYAKLVPQEIAGRFEHEITDLTAPDGASLADRLARHLADRSEAEEPTLQ